MSSNLGFVAHATERHSHELATERARHRTTKRRLPDSRRTDQTEDLSVQSADKRHHRDEVEDSVLDLVESVVVGVENGAGARDVEHFVGALRPRDRHDPVYEIAGNRKFGRHRRHPSQLSQLAQRPLFYG